MSAIQQRAYSILTIKSIDEDQRIVEGVATTPSTDRVGDVVDPMGGVFSLPLPLKWQHGKDAFVGDTPVGHVIAATPTTAGIPVRVQFAKETEQGHLKDILDFAWAAVKKRLVRAFSIGFRELEAPTPIKGSFGMRFTKWEWLELSAVTVPANADATISTIKSIDAGYLAASGMGTGTLKAGTPGGTGAVVRPAKKDAPTTMKKPYADQIKEFENSRAAKTARMDEIMAKSADEGLTLDDEQKQEYDGLEVELKSIDEHLVRLRAADDRQKAAAAASVPVVAKNPIEAAFARNPNPVITAKVNREPGIGMARVVMAQMASYLERGKSGLSGLEIAMKRWPSDSEVHAHIKTNIAAGTSVETNWATELVEPTTLGSEFLEFLRADTIIGKFGRNGVPALRSLPFNVRIPRMTAGTTGYWVGEGLAKPVSKGAVDAVSLAYTKVAAISIITKELARFSSPSAERVVRDELARSVTARLDTDFVDPAISATSARPASLTNGLTALSSAGTSADNARTDIMNLIEYFILNNMDVSSLVILMPNTLALALSILRNSLGQQEFPGLTLKGGTLEGIPVITSQYLASGASYGNMVVAVSANDVGFADDGAISIDVSGEASLEMTDTPLGDATTPTAGSTAVVSMFQTNSLAILAERFIHWKKLRATAAVYMDDVNWGAIGSPV